MSENVDLQEIARFSALAARWWDTTGEFQPLHAINPIRLNWIDERAGLSGKKVVDVGCGGGILSEGMVRRGAQVTGIDLGTAALAVARQHATATGLSIDYQEIAVEALAEQAAGTFDIVTCMEMLEHVPDPQSVISACQRLLKPDGLAFFSTINRNPKSWLFAIAGAEYLLKLLPRGTHNYSRFIRPSELAAMCRQAQLLVEDMIGLHYNPITRHYWLAENVDVNYLLFVRNPAQ